MRPVSNYGLVLIFESTFVTLHILVESLPLKLPAYRSARCLLPSMPDNMDSLPTPATRAEVFWQYVTLFLLSIECLVPGESHHALSDRAPSLVPIMTAPQACAPRSEYANKACTSREAKKIRHKILRDIEQLKKGSSGKTEEEQLKSLEESMAQYVKSLSARRQKMSHA